MFVCINVMLIMNKHELIITGKKQNIISKIKHIFVTQTSKNKNQ